MALYQLLRSESECEEGGSFSPDDVTRLTAAYEHTLELLELKDRTDPITLHRAARIGCPVVEVHPGVPLGQVLRHVVTQVGLR